MSLIYVIYKYIMTFVQISPEEYDRLIKNKNKIYDMTKKFSTPEILNKYREEDENINKNILNDENNEKYLQNLSKIYDKNLSKYFKEKENENKNVNKNMQLVEKEDLDYKFNSMQDIVNSFNKVFSKYKIPYNPQDRSRGVKIAFLLRKMNENIEVPRSVYRLFENNLRRLQKISDDIPLKKFSYRYEKSVEDNEDWLKMIKSIKEEIKEENDNEEDEEDDEDDEDGDDDVKQTGKNIFTNNIKIDMEALNKNILKIRYISNNRKLNNKLLKNDYKISNKMKEAIKFNKNIHKLSNDEKNIYYEIIKIMNKNNEDIDVLIGSYLAGNDNKNLYNKINDILYRKYKNDLISKKEYTNLLNKINSM